MSDPQILEGDLQSFDLPQVLKTLANRKATGILTVQGEEDIVAISCLNGHIVTADSLNQTQEESLGELLVSQGLVAQGDYDAVVMEHQGSGGSVGELLVGRGLITREKLLECLRLQTYRLMLQVLVWRLGEFKFYGGDEVSYEKGVTPISVEELLMRALTDLGSQSGLGGEVPKLDAIYRPVPPRGPVKILGRDNTGEQEVGAPGIWITDVQLAFLERMDGKASALEVARALGTGRFRTLFSLHQLVQNDLIEVESIAARTATPQPGSLPPQVAVATTTSDAAIATEPSLVDAGALTLNPAPAPSALEQQPSSTHIESPTSVRGAQPEASWSGSMSSYDNDDRTVVNVPVNPRPWVGVGLATILLVTLLSAFIERPIYYLFPFPWQADQRDKAESQVRQTLFHKIDGAIGAFYLMDFQYPRNLEELVARGLLAASDIEDPSGGTLKYSSADDGYRIEIAKEGEPREEHVRSIQEDFSRDLDYFSTELMKSPLELLD